MIAVALKGLAARKVRAVLTALAVVIGVAMVSGTFILTDTMQKSFNGLFAASFDGTDAVVSGREIVEDSTTGSGSRVPASMLTELRALPEVAGAAGTVSPPEANAADILGDDGKKVTRESVAVSVDRDNPQFSPLKLKTGAWPVGGDQVVIDAGTAAKKHYAVGDPVTVSTLGRAHTYTVSGTVKYGDTDSLGFASVVAWDLPTAQRVMHRPGQFDTVSVAAAKGTSQAELAKAIRPLLASNLVVKTAAAQADDNAENINTAMRMIRIFLLAFGGIALLVGGFVIFNTLSITVAQRTREFATLRTLGASQQQIMRSVRLEGLVLGLVASVVGLVAGLGIARGMVALFSAFGTDLPDAATVVSGKTIIISLVLGTGMTLLATIVPARRATRVPPIAAVREGATLPDSRSARDSRRNGIAVTAASLVALAGGALAGGIVTAVLLVAGVLGLFTGVALLAPHLVRPLTRVVGWPARHAGGVAGELAGANAVRNPRRTASTAAALMIGLTLVTIVAVLGASVRGATERAVDDQVRAGYVIDAEEGLPFRSDEGDRIARTPGVTAASHVRSDTVLLDGEEQAVSGIDPATIDHFYSFEWQPGSERAVAAMGTDGAIVSHSYADAHDLGIGERLVLTSPAGAKRTLVVRGIHEPSKIKNLLGDVSITQATFDATMGETKNSYTFLDASTAAGNRIETMVDGFGDARFHEGGSFAKDATKEMATMLAMLYVLLGFSIVVSLFGMINTMVLSVFERTREIGMLRTVGMSRSQARRMIRHESVITALIGAALGLGLGVFLAAVATVALSSYGLGLTIPLVPLAGFTLVAIAAGVAASVAPARRASRLDVLRALQYQ